MYSSCTCSAPLVKHYICHYLIVHCKIPRLKTIDFNSAGLFNYLAIGVQMHDAIENQMAKCIPSPIFPLICPCWFYGVHERKSIWGLEIKLWHRGKQFISLLEPSLVKVWIVKYWPVICFFFDSNKISHCDSHIEFTYHNKLCL